MRIHPIFTLQAPGNHVSVSNLSYELLLSKCFAGCRGPFARVFDDRGPPLCLDPQRRDRTGFGSDNRVRSIGKGFDDFLCRTSHFDLGVNSSAAEEGDFSRPAQIAKGISDHMGGGDLGCFGPFLDSGVDHFSTVIVMIRERSWPSYWDGQRGPWDFL